MELTDKIYEKYGRTVYRYLLSLTHDENVAEEVTQETFYQALRGIDRFDGSCRLSTWLCAIAKNQLQVYRRKHPEVESFDGFGETSKPPEAYTDTAVSAETEALGRMGEVDLLRKLHELPEPYRELFYLRVFGDLSFKDISTIMGKSENWARVTFYRGKERLRKEIEDERES